MEKIIIVAMTEKKVIGREGTMPWHIPAELQVFRRLTWGHTVVMGRRTFESIGKPLPGRINIVVSTTLMEGEGYQVCRDFGETVRRAEETGRTVFFIGGSEVFREALPIADALIISWIREDYPGDTFFPPYEPEAWREERSEEFEAFRVAFYRRRLDPTAPR